MNSTYHFKPINTFMHKTFQIENVSNTTQKIHVKSDFLGSWSFNLDNISFQNLCEKMEIYCECVELLQNIFPELTSVQREYFLTSPQMQMPFNQFYDDEH